MKIKKKDSLKAKQNVAKELLLKKIEFLSEEVISELLNYTEFLEAKYLKKKFCVPQTRENGVGGFFGIWPGEESDDEWNEMLEKLS